MSRSPSVFISYSWDSKGHRDWVRRLAARLVKNGVQVALDQWDVTPGESLTAFMETSIARSGHVLVICTPTYAKRANSRQGGVGYEQQIISGRIVQGVPRQKFIPIVKSGELTPGADCAIPSHFFGIYAIDMRTAYRLNKNFEGLLRAIYKKPKERRPPLGARPKFRRAKRGLLLSRARPIRLPTLEADRWQLDSGVVRHQMYPKTFQIPPENRRRAVKQGDYVKLPFEIQVSKRGDTEFERMWVKVKGIDGPYFTGTLSNKPIAGNRFNKLKFGSRVVFLPEHIIDIEHE